MTCRIILTLAILPMAATSALAADAPSAVLTTFGLTGTWSNACDRPVAVRNPRFSYEQKPGGQVDNNGDFGEGGPSRATIREASIDQDHRLHMTSYTLFDNLPKAMREAMAKTGSRPNVTTRSVLVMDAAGGVSIEDSVVEMEGSPGGLHIVSGGYVLNAATQAPGPKMPSLFKCSNAAEPQR